MKLDCLNRFTFLSVYRLLLATGDDEYTLEDMKKLHVCRKAWFEEQGDMLKISEYQDRMEAALENLDNCINRLPEEWFSCSTVKDDLIDNIVTRLNSYKNDKFWKPLQ